MEVDRVGCRVTAVLAGNFNVRLRVGGIEDRSGEIWRSGTVFCGAMFGSEERRGKLGLIQLRLLVLRIQARLGVGHRGAL